MRETVAGANDLDLISCLKTMPDAQMRPGVRFAAWYLLLVAVLGILSSWQWLQDKEGFDHRHHGVLTDALGHELRRWLSNSSLSYFFLQVEVAALCAAIRGWIIA